MSYHHHHRYYRHHHHPLLLLCRGNSGAKERKCSGQYNASHGRVRIVRACARARFCVSRHNRGCQSLSSSSSFGSVFLPAVYPKRPARKRNSTGETPTRSLANDNVAERRLSTRLTLLFQPPAGRRGGVCGFRDSSYSSCRDSSTR